MPLPTLARRTATAFALVTLLAAGCNDGGGGGGDSENLDPETPSNQPPELATAELTTDEGTAGTVSLSATDPDGDVLSYAVTGAPSNGSASVDAGGTATYTPNADYAGSDAFTVEVTDGNGGSATATVSVTIDAAEKTGYLFDAPVEGVRYESPNLSGYTGPDGRFEYREGEKTTFDLGGITLGETKGADIVTPRDLVEGSLENEGSKPSDEEISQRTTNVARVLQTFDADGNPDNGLVFTDSVRKAVESASEVKDGVQNIAKNGASEEKLQNLASEVSENLKKSIELRTEAEADDALRWANYIRALKSEKGNLYNALVSNLDNSAKSLFVENKSANWGALENSTRERIEYWMFSNGAAKQINALRRAASDKAVAESDAADTNRELIKAVKNSISVISLSTNVAKKDRCQFAFGLAKNTVNNVPGMSLGDSLEATGGEKDIADQFGNVVLTAISTVCETTNEIKPDTLFILDKALDVADFDTMIDAIGEINEDVKTANGAQVAAEFAGLYFSVAQDLPTLEERLNNEGGKDVCLLLPGSECAETSPDEFELAFGNEVNKYIDRRGQATNFIYDGLEDLEKSGFSGRNEPKRLALGLLAYIENHSSKKVEDVDLGVALRQSLWAIRASRIRAEELVEKQLPNQGYAYFDRTFSSSDEAGKIDKIEAECGEGGDCFLKVYPGWPAKDYKTERWAVDWGDGQQSSFPVSPAICESEDGCTWVPSGSFYKVEKDYAVAGEHEALVTFRGNTAETTIDISGIGEPPKAELTTQHGQENVTVQEGDEVILDPTGSTDPDGKDDSLVFEWETPSDVTLNDVQDPRDGLPYFTAPRLTQDSRTLTFTMTVTDEQGNSSTTEIEITVQGSQEDRFPNLDAYKSDEDNDGLPDSWEREYFGNLNQDADEDPDGDGLTNMEEFYGEGTQEPNYDIGDSGIRDSEPHETSNNQSPTADAMTLEVLEGHTVQATLSASDPDNDPLAYGHVPGFGPEHGDVRVKADGSFAYTANSGYTGEDAFTYQVQDGNGGSATAEVSINMISPLIDVLTDIAPTRILTGDEAKVQVEIGQAEAPYEVKVEWGDGNQSYQSSLNIDFATYTHTFSSAGDYNPEVTVTDAQDRSFSETLSLKVSDQAASTTQWYAEAHNMDTVAGPYDVDLSVSEKTFGDLTVDAYSTQEGLPDGEEVFVRHGLPVPSGVIDLANKVRITAVVKAGDKESFDRELYIKTPARKFQANIVDPSVQAGLEQDTTERFGVFRVSDLVKGTQRTITREDDSRLEAFYQDAFPAEPSHVTGIAFELQESAVSVQSYDGNNEYQELYSYNATNLGAYLSEIGLTYLGEGTTVLATMEYDQDGDGSYEKEEKTVLTTGDKQVDWPGAQRGDGSAGTRYTKIGANGDPLPADAKNWSCVQDKETGLMWEVKNDNGGLRDKNYQYTWYNGSFGDKAGGECSSEPCNTNNYKKIANKTINLCGYSDWRIPEKSELLSGPDESVEYFPFGGYVTWTKTRHHFVSDAIHFGNFSEAGHADRVNKNTSPFWDHGVRLVRDVQ